MGGICWGLWKSNERGGVAIRGNYEWGVSWLHLGIDAKTGIGKGTFLAIQPKVGGILSSVLYADLGIEFSTRGDTTAVFQIGINLY